ncbi:MAG TPA: YbaB/EbfC family nucleoid-associated protein [Pseudonocardiaceae bacterium]|nr:YbaB/EbfC family nucleoid-associated protein [Pseudonocardiaceae bacterium]
MAVPTNHRDEVAQLLADYRRGREQLAAVQRALLSIVESASSPDGLVTASVDSAGTLTGLVITDQAYQRYRPADLADTIVRTTRAAAAKAGERARQALAPVLPPDTDPAAALAGRADLTDDEIGPPTPPMPMPAISPPPRPIRERPNDDEDSYEDTSWLSGRRT